MPATEAVQMIEPPPRAFITGAACLIARNGPIRFTRRISCQSSGVCSKIEARPPEMPALAKKMSSPPCSPTASLDQADDVLLAPGIGRDHAFGRVHVRRDHGRALGREQGRGRLADPRRRAGDDRDLAVQSVRS